MNKLLLFVVSMICFAGKDECVSYFNIVSGVDHTDFRATSCEEALNVLSKIPKADGVSGLQICTKEQCNYFGPLTINSVIALLKQKIQRNSGN